MTVEGQMPKSTISAELNVHRLHDDDELMIFLAWRCLPGTGAGAQHHC